MKPFAYLMCLLLCAFTACSKRMTLADVHSKDDLVEYGKTEEAQADAKAGAELVKQLKAEFPKKSCEELIDLLKTYGFTPDGGFSILSPGGPSYYLYRDGNAEIIEELRARGEKAREALMHHSNDARSIFTGANGPGYTVASICYRLLEELDKGRPNARDGDGIPLIFK